MSKSREKFQLQFFQYIPMFQLLNARCIETFFRHLIDADLLEKIKDRQINLRKTNL